MDTEHGIRVAHYKREEGDLVPTLECLCGEEFQGDNWEEAGWEFDEHLNEEA